MLRKKRVNKKCQHLSILIESQLAGWPAGDCSQFSASSWDSLCICFQRGVLKLVLFGVSILEALLFSWEMHQENGSVTGKVI